MRTHDDDFVARMFVASTHTPVLFFSSLGRVYKLKVYRLPLGTPQARGRAMINMFPALSEGESISAVMPLPEDEALWETMSVFFATAAARSAATSSPISSSCPATARSPWASTRATG